MKTFLRRWALVWPLGLGLVCLYLAVFVFPYRIGADFLTKAGWLFGALFLLYWLTAALTRHTTLGRAARLVRKIMRFGCLLFVLSFVVIEGLLIAGAHSDPPQETDAVIVLGAGLVGESPSQALRARLEAAVRYWNAYPDTVLIVTGGQGADELISEAEAMRRYLVDRGVPDAQILCEDRARNTEENFAFSVVLLPEGAQTVGVVSNEFHLFRSRILARREGLVPVAISAPTPRLDLKILYFVREYFSILFMFL